MKTFILILLFSFTSQVKQLQIYEAEEAGTKYLMKGYAAIADSVIYIKADNVIYTFHIEKITPDKSRTVYQVHQGIVIDGICYPYSGGFIILMPESIGSENSNPQGRLSVEIWTERKARRVIYKYR